MQCFLKNYYDIPANDCLSAVSCYVNCKVQPFRIIFSASSMTYAVLILCSSDNSSMMFVVYKESDAMKNAVNRFSIGNMLLIERKIRLICTIKLYVFK